MNRRKRYGIDMAELAPEGSAARRILDDFANEGKKPVSILELVRAAIAEEEAR